MELVMEPQSLQDAILYFADPVNCREYLVARRWPKGVTCPRCGSQNVQFYEKYNRWHCREKHNAPQFTLKTGTVMEDSPIGLDKWLMAMWMVVNCKNGVSSYEIHRALKVTQKTAWFLDHRIRLMLQDEYASKLSGEVEADETFIGGKARNMHKKVHERRISGMGQSAKDKTIVMGVLERGGKVRTQLIPDRRNYTLQPVVRKHVEPGATLYTDEMGGYKGLGDDYLHQIINHAVEYVNGRVHTNGLENFWSLLKRGINGTYVSIEPFHLFRYLDEQSFRFNNRKLTDAQRFDIAARGMVGKRLTYAEVTGKVGEIEVI
jgi:transposase-like protein